MTDWYRRQIEEIHLRNLLDEERAKSVGQPLRTQAAVSPSNTEIPKPWEGITETAKAFGINLGELWQTREHELSEARQATAAMEKELHELRVREIDRRVEELQKLAAATSRQIEGGGDNNQRGRYSRIDDILDKILGERLSDILGGSKQQLTAEDVRNIVEKTVQNAKENKQTPEQMAEAMMSFVTAAETFKQKIGNVVGGNSGPNTYLTQTGDMRPEVLRLILENDREKLRLNQQFQIQQERNMHLGTLATTFKENVEDMIGAARDVVQDHRQSGKSLSSQQGASEQEGYSIKCNLCGATSIFPEIPTGEFECPNCHGRLRLEKPQGPPQSPQQNPLEI